MVALSLAESNPLIRRIKLLSLVEPRLDADRGCHWNDRGDRIELDRADRLRDRQFDRRCCEPGDHLALHR